jgi:hypothetical protein
MQNTHQSLLPAVIQSSAIKPKPTKGEIISALVILRANEIRTENEVRTKRRTVLKRKIDRTILALFRKNYTKMARVGSYGYLNYGSRSITVHLDCKATISGVNLEIPAEILADITEYEKIAVIKLDEKALRTEITDELNSRQSKAVRVNALLADPDTRLALSTMLNDLTGSESKTVTV